MSVKNLHYVRIVGTDSFTVEVAGANAGWPAQARAKACGFALLKFRRGSSFDVRHRLARMKQCTYCGKEYPDEAEVCAIDQNPLPSDTPDTPAPRVQPQDKSPSAGFGIRAVARIVDVIYGMFVGYSAGIFTGLSLRILNSAGMLPIGWQHHLRGLTPGTFAFGFLAAVTYHFLCEGIHGATLGKFCCGICVVSEDGGPSTLKGALVRSVGYYVDALFFGLVGYHSMKSSPINQRYGDRWGKTAVFRTKDIALESQRAPVVLISALLLGTVCWFVIIALSLILKVL
jgi:uncharacterized RDD family membrane protein YckC